MPFGLGLAILFLTCISAEAPTGLDIFTGQIVGVDDLQTRTLVTPAVLTPTSCWR